MGPGVRRDDVEESRLLTARALFYPARQEN
jgi:hypothetical protein